MSGNFEMLANGNLVIRNIQNSHQGDFTCVATNDEGEARSTGYLRVFRQFIYSFVLSSFMYPKGRLFGSVGRVWHFGSEGLGFESWRLRCKFYPWER